MLATTAAVRRSHAHCRRAAVATISAWDDGAELTRNGASLQPFSHFNHHHLRGDCVTTASLQASCCGRTQLQPFSTTASRAEQPTKTTASSTIDQDKVERVFRKIIYLDVVEVQLVTALLKEKLGMNGGAARMSSAGTQSTASAGSTAEASSAEKTHFDLKLAGFDAKSKIKVIKEVRAITGLGLKEAKELVEGAPKVVKKDLKKEEVEQLKAKLEEAGATVEVL